MPQYGEPLNWDELNRERERVPKIDPEAQAYIQSLLDQKLPGGRLIVGSEVRKEKLATSRAARSLGQNLRWRYQKPRDGVLEFVLYGENEQPPGVKPKGRKPNGGEGGASQEVSGRQGRG